MQLTYHYSMLSVDQLEHKYYIPKLPYYLFFHMNGLIFTTERTVMRPLIDTELTPV